VCEPGVSDADMEMPEYDVTVGFGDWALVRDSFEWEEDSEDDDDKEEEKGRCCEAAELDACEYDAERLGRVDTVGAVERVSGSEVVGWLLEIGADEVSC
jgi:hypothetical protein